MTDERSSQLYLENCIQREISYENKRVELIQQDIRGNVNNIIKKQTIVKQILNRYQNSVILDILNKIILTFNVGDASTKTYPEYKEKRLL